jgi:hypothetical protein
MIVEADGVDVYALLGELLGGIGNRLDAIGDLRESLANGLVRRPASLEIDHSEHRLVVVPGPVVDLPQRVVQQVEAAITFCNALVDLPLVERDHRENEQLREAGDDEAGQELAVFEPEAPLIGDDNVPSEQLCDHQRNQTAAPTCQDGGNNDGEEVQGVGRAISCDGIHRQPQRHHGDRSGQSNRDFDEHRRYAVREPLRQTRM